MNFGIKYTALKINGQHTVQLSRIFPVAWVYRADQFTLTRFEIHSYTCHERKPDKEPANFRLQPQKEGITIVCNAYENFHAKNPPIATNFLREMLSLILKNSFQFNGKDYLETHGTAMGTKMAVAFANIFMASIEKEIRRQSINKPLTWKRFIDDVFCLWDTNKEEIEHFIEQANSYHPTIKFTAEDSQLETTFLDTTVYKGERFEKESILDVRTHYKPTETFQYTNYNSCHTAGVKKGFVKGEALRLLRTNSSKDMFDKNIKNFRTHLISRGYPDSLVDKILSEVNFADRKNALTQKQKAQKKILPFVTQFQPSLPCLKNILMDKWNLIQNQPLLREIYKEPPLISYRKGKSLKDMVFINTMGTQRESRWSVNAI